MLNRLTRKVCRYNPLFLRIQWEPSMDINIYGVDFRLFIAKAQFDKFTTADYLGVTVKTIVRILSKSG